MDDEVFSYKTVFGKANKDVIIQFFHSIIDGICGRKQMTYQQFNNNVQWDENEYNIAKQFATELFRNPMLLYLEDERMPQEYVESPTDLQLLIRNVVNVRREQLVNALLQEQAIKDGTTLIDFDWRLKWVIGSSKLATLKEPLLQLDLIVEDKQSQRIIDLELNKDEIDMLINTLEEVK